MSASSSGAPVSRMMVPNQQLESQFVHHQQVQEQILCKSQEHSESANNMPQHQYVLNLQEHQHQQQQHNLHIPHNVHVQRQYVTQPRSNLNAPRINSNSENNLNTTSGGNIVQFMSPSSSSEQLYTSNKSNGNVTLQQHQQQQSPQPPQQMQLQQQHQHQPQQTVITNVNYLSLPTRNTEPTTNTNNSTNIPNSNPSNSNPTSQICSSAVLQHQSHQQIQFVKKPTVNVAAGWKRVLVNNEIVYVR